MCNATDSATPFQCGEWFERFDTPDIEPQDCSGVHGAKYCIKHIGRFEGILLRMSRVILESGTNGCSERFIGLIYVKYTKTLTSKHKSFIFTHFFLT